MDILQFVPKYPNIENLKENILNPYKNNFNNVIYHKKEFYEKKLESQEGKPSKPGILTNHQEIILRFLSAHTLYNFLLVDHEMGTGKACVAFGSIEKIRESGLFKKAIVLTTGKGLIENLKKELVFTCTDGRYIPENYDELPSQTKVARINKILNEFYEFETFGIFAKKIKGMSNKKIKEEYSNCVIVIDEVQHIREMTKKEEMEGIETYKNLHRFMHVVEDCKKIIMSGTPMKDSVEEIASVMNLGLPSDMQLPSEKKFIKEYLKPELDGSFSIINKERLKKYFKGRVSYLRAVVSSTEKVFEGKVISPLKIFKVYPDKMSDFQFKYYLEAISKDLKSKDNEDKESKKAGIFSNSRQASLFVYPNGTWGTDGFKKYIIEKKTKSAFTGKTSTTYTLSPELYNQLKGNSEEDILKNVERYSMKYANCIRSILQGEKEISFVYCDLVKGSGAILFSKILELFNFNQTKSLENTKSRRYSLLVGSSEKISKILQNSSREENMYGEYIRVIIGSKVIVEGFTIKNAQQTHILTPFWNYSETNQAIGRTLRLFSHDDFEKKGINIKLKIFLHCSISDEKLKNNDVYIDLHMYSISEKKDMSIKRMERIIKESSFDCALTYERNTSEKDLDGSRECDYQKCKYDCDGIKNISGKLTENKLDFSTYNLYYSFEVVSRIKESIKKLFKKEFFYDFDQIISHIKINNFNVITALSEIIFNNEPIVNKYGFTSYLKEQNNLYFLVNNFTDSNSFYLGWYNKYPSVYDKILFETKLNKIKNKNTLNIIEEICKLKNGENIKKLPLDIQEVFIEASILNKVLSKTKNKLTDFILENYKIYIHTLEDGTYVSSFLLSKKKILRCLEKPYNVNGWKDCSPENKEEFENLESKDKEELEKNKYGYYGIIDASKKDKFLIRDILTEKKGDKKDKRKIYKGKACSSWTIPDLINLALKIRVSISEDKKFIDDLNKKELIGDLIVNKNIIKLYPTNTKEKLGEIKLRKLKLLYYLAELTKSNLCKVIEEEFNNKKLLLNL